MEKSRLGGTSRLIVLCIFVVMCGVFLGIGGLLAGWVFAKPLLIGSGIGLVAIFWLTDALKPETFDRFSFRKRKQD
ncbi:hypothetical protein RMR16_006920 [Agrobacterium sp. rho-13.3]|uniref:hypothetical protein n=1 Tax=Agrobacterium sp. rho-13.3 TaxID=3072980 RepID=UPI002A0AFF1F|nr:hypothetical protein [Agrobacterium sp. rho-13.3]MDX8311184.1 hypothetical protein [Agrobacterium sp. rho-13.3]